MTCGLLHPKFDAAVDAVKEAFKEAVDAKDFDRSTLSEVWRHYQGLQTIAEGLPKHTHTVPEDLITFGNDITINTDDLQEDVVFPDGTYNPDYNITFPEGDIKLDLDSVSLSQ
tara:strand:+ start:748 stop:1086 length:339 start_codon:yes stop_codon:yes gene_type:complete